MTPARKKDPVVVDGKFIMMRYPGKGGWTYVTIPPFGEHKKTSFAYQKINLEIDGYKIENASIWKTKEGNFFLPVKAEIRKKIGKQEGDTVRIVLSEISGVLDHPDEIFMCLKEEPLALRTWKSLPAAEQKRLSDWIMSAPREQMKVDRLADLMNDLVKGKKITKGQK